MQKEEIKKLLEFINFLIAPLQWNNLLELSQ